jgi:hypothetical protein
VSALGIVLGLIAAWFSLSSVDYDGATDTTRFTSGGWFILGFPFVLMGSMAYGAAFAALARRTNSLLSVVVMVALSGYLTYTFAVWQLPSSRLREIVGEMNDPRVAVKRLQTRGSFNDGDTTYCVIALPRDLLPKVLERERLQAKEEQSLRFASVVAEGDLPSEGTVYSNDRMRA